MGYYRDGVKIGLYAQIDIVAASPTFTLKNNTAEDTDGGRESQIVWTGTQSGGEESTLAQIQASHDGAADDQKGDLIFKVNDGDDGTSPTEVGRVDSAGLWQFISGGTIPSWGHSPVGIAVEGISEFDGQTYFGHNIYIEDDKSLIMGGSADTLFGYETADADALHMCWRLPETDQDASNVPVLAMADHNFRNVDIGLFDGQTQPLIAFFDKAGVIKSSTSGTHDGVDGDELTETNAFTDAAVGDIVRITAGTNVTTGWYWITTKTDNSNVDLDRAFVTGANGQANVAYVVYDSTAWIGAEGVKLRTFDGAPGDGDFEIDADGWLALDVANSRLYWRAGNGWHYAAQDAGFEIAAGEENCPNCGEPMQPGEAVMGVLDRILDDGARHGHYVHARCANKRRRG